MAGPASQWSVPVSSNGFIYTGKGGRPVGPAWSTADEAFADTQTHRHTHTHMQTHPLAPIHDHHITLSLSLGHTHTPSNAHTHFDTHTHTHTYIYHTHWHSHKGLHPWLAFWTFSFPTLPRGFACITHHALCLSLSPSLFLSLSLPLSFSLSLFLSLSLFTFLTKGGYTTLAHKMKLVLYIFLYFTHNWIHYIHL